MLAYNIQILDTRFSSRTLAAMQLREQFLFPIIFEQQDKFSSLIRKQMIQNKSTCFICHRTSKE